MLDSVSGLILLTIGVGAGFLLAVVGGRCTRAVKQFKQFWKQRQQILRERAALSDLEEAAIEIDEERITCVLCWEARHPGSSWSFPWRLLCQEHQLQYAISPPGRRRGEDAGKGPRRYKKSAILTSFSNLWGECG